MSKILKLVLGSIAVLVIIGLIGGTKKNASVSSSALPASDSLSPITPSSAPVLGLATESKQPASQDLARTPSPIPTPSPTPSATPKPTALLTQPTITTPTQSKAPSPKPSPEVCAIKGNISGSGHIFHVPGQRYYKETIINASNGEKWFCSEKEAEDAGWRKSKV
jgi:hypothetical protein